MSGCADYNRDPNAKGYIHGELVGDAATWSTYADYLTRYANRTIATIDWQLLSGLAANSWYNSPDISSIIQEIVNLPTYAAGNDIGLFLEDLITRSSNIASFYSFDGAPAKAMKLIINYTDPEPPPSPTAGPGQGLPRIDPRSFGHTNIDGDAPQFWFPWGDKIIVEPVSNAYQYYLTAYYADYPSSEMTSDSDEPSDLPEEFQESVVDFAIAFMWLKLKKYRRFAEAYNAYINNLKARQRLYLTSKADTRNMRKIPDRVRVLIPSRRKYGNINAGNR
jgi:hypothetical protein